MYVYIHACATAKLESQRTAGTRHQERAQRPRAALNYYYTTVDCGTQETPGAPEDTRGNKEEHQRDRRAKRHHEPQGPEGTEGGSGETPRGPGGTTGGSEQTVRIL
jgi:hypothetical protein